MGGDGRVPEAQTSPDPKCRDALAAVTCLSPAQPTRPWLGPLIPLPPCAQRRVLRQPFRFYGPKT